MKPIKVAVYGALGRMGQTLVDALYREPDMQLVGAVDIKAAKDELPLPDGSGTVPLSQNLDEIIRFLYLCPVIMSYKPGSWHFVSFQTIKKQGHCLCQS